MGGGLITRFREVVPECAIVVASALDASDFPVADAILPKPFTGAQVRQVLADLTTLGRIP